jgi:hypothetical protein
MIGTQNRTVRCGFFVGNIHIAGRNAENNYTKGAGGDVACTSAAEFRLLSAVSSLKYSGAIVFGEFIRQCRT